MRKIFNSFISLIAIAFFCIAIRGSLESHHTYTVPRDTPTIIDEAVELKQPEHKEQPIPEVRLATFEDEFAVKPLIRNLTDEDKELLMRIAQAEAGNQDIIGRALVMLTVLNRCEKNGASVRATIYAPCQFYTKGMCSPDEKTREAMEMVLYGWDESEGCLYFCSTGWNYYGDTHLFKHGDHWFSK